MRDEAFIRQAMELGFEVKEGKEGLVLTRGPKLPVNQSVLQTLDQIQQEQEQRPDDERDWDELDGVKALKEHLELMLEQRKERCVVTNPGNPSANWSPRVIHALKRAGYQVGGIINGNADVKYLEIKGGGK